MLCDRFTIWKVERNSDFLNIIEFKVLKLGRCPASSG